MSGRAAQQQRMRRKSVYLTEHDAEKAEMKANKAAKRLSLQSNTSNDSSGTKSRKQSVVSSSNNNSRRQSVAPPSSSNNRKQSIASNGRRSSVASLMSFMSLGTSEGGSRRGSIFGSSDSRRSSFMSFGRRDSSAYSTHSTRSVEEESEAEDEKKPALETSEEVQEPEHKPTFRDYQKQSIADSFANTAAPGPGADNMARRGSTNFSRPARRMSYYPPPVVASPAYGSSSAAPRRMSTYSTSNSQRRPSAYLQTSYREVPASHRRKSTYV